jgi:hypothetical protein
MSVVGGKAENICSYRVFRLLTQAVWKRARAEDAQNCFLSFPLPTVTGRSLLFLFNAIETNFLRARMSIRSGSDREGVTRRIDWPGRIVRSERTL